MHVKILLVMLVALLLAAAAFMLSDSVEPSAPLQRGRSTGDSSQPENAPEEGVVKDGPWTESLEGSGLSRQPVTPSASRDRTLAARSDFSQPLEHDRADDLASGGTMVSLRSTKTGEKIRQFEVTAVDWPYPDHPSSWLRSQNGFYRGGRTEKSATVTGRCHVPWIGSQRVALLISVADKTPVVFENVQASEPGHEPAVAELDFIEKRGGEITGWVRGTYDHRFSATVKFAPEQGSPVPTLQQFYSGAERECRVNEDGSYRLIGATPTTRGRITIEINGQDLVYRQPISVAEGEVSRYDFTVPLVEVLEVRLLLDGIGIPGIDIASFYEGHPGVLRSPARTDASGTALVLFPAGVEEITVKPIPSATKGDAILLQIEALRGIAGKDLEREIDLLLYEILNGAGGKSSSSRGSQPTVLIELAKRLSAMDERSRRNWSRRLKEAATKDFDAPERARALALSGTLAEVLHYGLFERK